MQTAAVDTVADPARVRVERFFDGDAADERRNLAWNLVETAECHLFPAELYPANSSTLCSRGPENSAVPTAPFPHGTPGIWGR